MQLLGEFLRKFMQMLGELSIVRKEIKLGEKIHTTVMEDCKFVF